MQEIKKEMESGSSYSNIFSETFELMNFYLLYQLAQHLLKDHLVR